jgi:hypothetical protein
MFEHCAVPEGTQIYFRPYPALRLRLRAGLNCAAPMALDFPRADATDEYQVSFSYTLLLRTDFLGNCNHPEDAMKKTI